MKNHDTQPTLLERCTATAQMLSDLISYADGSIVSKTVIDKPVGTVTLFAFDKGQRLSEHTASYDALVQVVEGVAEIVIDGKAVEAQAGQVVVMPAGVPHAVNANEKFKMLLTMIRA